MISLYLSFFSYANLCFYPQASVSFLFVSSHSNEMKVCDHPPLWLGIIDLRNPLCQYIFDSGNVHQGMQWEVLNDVDRSLLGEGHIRVDHLLVPSGARLLSRKPTLSLMIGFPNSNLQQPPLPEPVGHGS